MVLVQIRQNLDFINANTSMKVHEGEKYNQQTLKCFCLNTKYCVKN